MTTYNSSLSGALSFGYASLVHSLSPVGWWRLNEASGATTAADSSGNGKNSTSIGSGVTFGAAGPFPGSGAATFTGVGAIVAPNVVTNVGTAVAWIKYTGASTHGGAIMLGDGTGPGWGVGMGANAGGSWDSAGTTLYGLHESIAWLAGGATISASTWHMLAMTENAGAWGLYLDGVLKASGSTTVNNANATTIGGDGTVSTRYFTGQISEAAVFSSVLPASTLLAMYQAGTAAAQDLASHLPLTRMTLAGSIAPQPQSAALGYDFTAQALTPSVYLKLDEASGATAVDSGSLAINWTYQGSPTLHAGALYTGGQSVTFAGGQYANVATAGIKSFINGLTSVSVAGWFKINQATEPWLVTCLYDGSRVPFSLGLGGDSGNNTKIHWGCYNAGWSSIMSTTSVSSGTPIHVAATMTSSGPTKLWINGVPEATGTVGATGWASWTANEIRLSRRWDVTSTSNTTQGGVSIYNYALSDAQVANLYAASTATTGTGFAKQIVRGIAAGLTFVGLMGRRIPQSLTAALDFLGLHVPNKKKAVFVPTATFTLSASPGIPYSPTITSVVVPEPDRQTFDS